MPILRGYLIIIIIAKNELKILKLTFIYSQYFSEINPKVTTFTPQFGIFPN